MLDVPARFERLNLGPPVRRRRKAGRPSADRPPALVGWLSDDAEEIERRRWRGRTEIGQVEPVQRDAFLFGDFRVRSASGRFYEVEIRSLDLPLNSCGCADHQVNGLGTCKHIEGVLERLRRRGVRAFRAAQLQGGPRIELFVARAGDALPSLLWPAEPDSVAAGTRDAVAVSRRRRLARRCFARCHCSNAARDRRCRTACATAGPRVALCRAMARRGAPAGGTR